MTSLILAFSFLYLHKMRSVTLIRLMMFSFLMANSIAYGQKDTTLANSNDTSVSKGSADETYSITITVTGIRNDKGTIRFKFYDDSTPFPHDTGFLKFVVDKSEVVGGIYTHTFTGFKSQNMGIALLDDENNNVLLDMGWLLPKEGHAFSNYYHSALRRPVYKDFRFFLSSDRTVIMKMKYY